MGNCLAGDTCIFSHDPAALVSRLTMDDGSIVVGTPPQQNLQPSFQLQDFDSFPALQPMAANQWANSSYPSSMGSSGFQSNLYGGGGFGGPLPALNKGHASIQSGNGFSPRPNSRPTSRHQSREATPAIPVDDTDAFPSLGSAGSKMGKKHHGKRGGHGHCHSKESIPSSLADIVRMSPSPAPGLLRKGLMKNRSFTGSREYSTAAQAIPSPQHVPWLETGEKANQMYLKARQDAIKHGGLRNKFLQRYVLTFYVQRREQELNELPSAAQAWNRNDARAAKALSLRGQSENDLMRKAHREAARLLYEERNKDSSSSSSSSNPSTSSELYVDLHGLHPEEAVEYLERVLLEQASSTRPIYAITGTGHHSKNGKDKVGKAIRIFLNEWKYAFREFSVPGDRNNVGGILGIDARSCERSAVIAADVGERDQNEGDGGRGSGVRAGEGKGRVVKEGGAVPTGPRGKS